MKLEEEKLRANKGMRQGILNMVIASNPFSKVNRFYIKSKLLLLFSEGGEQQMVISWHR